MSADDDRDLPTTRVTRKGQVTIPKSLREEYDLEEGDELVWHSGDRGITVRKATRTAGRGMLVDDVSEETREEVASELEADIRERRRSQWTPE